MKNKILLILAASALLASCGESSSSSEASSQAETTAESSVVSASSEAEPVAESSASEESTSTAEATSDASVESSASVEESESETPPSTEPSSEATSMDVDVSGWTEEEAAIILKCLHGVGIPSFGVVDYILEESEDETYFEVLAEPVEEEIDYYVTTLEDLGFTLLYEEGYSHLEADFYAADYSYAYVYLELTALEEGGYELYIYGTYFETEASWPEEYIAEVAKEIGISQDIPAYEDAEAYNAYVGNMHGILDYIGVECYGESIGYESVGDYQLILEENGYTYDEDYEVYVKGGTYIEVGYNGVYMLILAYDLGESGASWGENWVLPEAGDGVFNFESEGQLVTKDASRSVWEAGDATFTIDKATSTVNVGNLGSGKEFFANPLRVYNGQTITITSKTAFTSIDFYAVEDEKVSYENLYYASVAPGSWALDEEKQIVRLVLDEAVTEVVITLDEGQVRLYAAALTYVE